MSEQNHNDMTQVAQAIGQYGMAKQVAVLFARKDSVYKTFDGVDVWDAQRDALNWPGGSPVVAHPPCRAWGQLAQFAKPRPGEKDYALYAVEMVRKFGGVLEHPIRSRLWQVKNLPLPNQFDEYGGWTLPVFQSVFGHACEKPTYLYICGIKPKDVPSIQITPGDYAGILGSHFRRKDGTRKSSDEYGYRKAIPVSDRERTPLNFAKWLVEVARRCEARNV